MWPDADTEDLEKLTFINITSFPNWDAVFVYSR